MNGFRAIRRQSDTDQDEISESTGLACTDDKARQEFAKDADVNVLLARYGVGISAQQRQPVYGEVDWDLNLQTALHAIRQAEQMHQTLPGSLRERYPNWQDVLNGIYTGQLRIDLSAEASKNAGDAPVTDRPAENQRSHTNIVPPPAS